jgi:putative membrane protein
MLGAALVFLAGCQRAEQAATTVQSAAQAQTTPTLSTTDATFLNLAGTSGIEEVNFGQVAASKASSPAVRRFAQDMVTSHTKLNQQLVALAKAKQMTPPSSMDMQHDQMLSTLQGQRGSAFDRAYMTGQVNDHQMSIEAYQTEISNGTDPDVKSFAQQGLPILQQHLAMAQKLAPAAETEGRKQ